MAANARKHVLDGFKALDFTQFVAGPTVTKLMAEMGAEVIKVEFAPDGDRSRGMPYLKNQRSGYFVQQNRGKLSLCVDVKNPAGRKIIRDLIPKVDVLVENFAPGVIARMGFDYENVKELNPKIIMCSVSTFGQTGPLANDPGYDFIGQAYAGVTSLSGEEGGPHYPPMLAIGDVSTGVHALAAIACALLHRDRSGEGQYLDISLLDSYFHYHDLGLQIDQREWRRDEAETHWNALSGALPGRNVQGAQGLYLRLCLARPSLGEAVRDDGTAGTRA